MRSLPTFGIFSESRESLTELTKCTLDILAASSGYQYTSKDIAQKINYVMTDSTAHNLNVIQQVCDDLEVETTPSTLLCNVHPLMMFQGKIKQLCQQIHESLGKSKISECFLVDVEFRNESFVVKAVKCLSNFINREYSAKPWNRSNHFADFIKPRQNMSLSLKDHRFNRLQDCCLSLLYHLDEIADYLTKYTNIVNGITVLDRSFVEMEILKPIFAAISLLGVHITRPFQTLLMDSATTYSVLLTAFKQLYNDLTTKSATEYNGVSQVATFVTEDVFKKSSGKS